MNSGTLRIPCRRGGPPEMVGARLTECPASDSLSHDMKDAMSGPVSIGAYFFVCPTVVAVVSGISSCLLDAWGYASRGDRSSHAVRQRWGKARERERATSDGST